MMSKTFKATKLGGLASHQYPRRPCHITTPKRTDVTPIAFILPNTKRGKRFSLTPITQEDRSSVGWTKDRGRLDKGSDCIAGHKG